MGPRLSAPPGNLSTVFETKPPVRRSGVAGHVVLELVYPSNKRRRVLADQTVSLHKFLSACSSGPDGPVVAIADCVISGSEYDTDQPPPRPVLHLSSADTSEKAP